MDRDFLERIDRHMERGNEIMERVEQELQLTRELHAEYMQEIREVRRGYRITIRQLFDLVRENREAMRDNREAMQEMAERSDAHTKAIWALLDRLEGDGPAPATG